MARDNEKLNLRVGEIVEVRAPEEILATLNEAARLDNVPFMPEMLQYCGRRFRVFRRSDKTCDNIGQWSIRAMKDTVHLEGLRCDGSAHGDCQAGCLIFWKEAWLKRVDSANTVSLTETRRSPCQPGISADNRLYRITQHAGTTDSAGEYVYSCQATDVLKFTSPLAIWDVRQYVRDVRSGNISTGLASESKSDRVLDMAIAVTDLVRALIIGLYNRVQARRDGVHYPRIIGEQSSRAPVVELNLQPGEVVQVRSREEIIATLDKRNRNRGLSFDSEMLRYCGGLYRVLRRVRQIVDEKTGKMIYMKHPCIILEGVWCRSDYHRFCPRAIFHYWREEWLERVQAPDAREHAEAPCLNTASHFSTPAC
jgi:hypothetical protein